MATRGKALVTGASSGIGRETAVRLAQEGFQVIAAARRQERLEELARQNPNILPRPVDLSDAQALEEFSQELLSLSEPVTVLINNAAYSIRGAIEDVPVSKIRGLFEVNLFSLIRITQACLPGMRRLRIGTIVNLSSIVGKFPFPTSGPYSATKHAVEAISDALRMEVRPFGIRVVTIRPGVIGTEFNETANRLTGDLLSRTDPDYKPVYQAYGAGIGRLFANVKIPGPELIADLIVKAVLSDSPRAVYAAGPFVEELLGERFRRDDEGFFEFMMEKTGLKGLAVPS
ncbi:MAG: SDR family oxidoreductase [Desulfobacterota bacterium]|nr:SDR family oxidoreductase [Thermodesulfobacteriota bacterium]